MKNILVIGQGEIGKPLGEFIEESGKYKVFKKDIDPLEINEPIEVMHVYIPFSEKFADIVIGYINQYKPKLTIIGATVKPGTTETIYTKTNSLIVHSPYRGKHSLLKQEHLKRFVKFIGPTSEEAGKLAKEYFDSLEIPNEILDNAKTTEFGKIFSTTYYAMNITFHQEMNRICEKFGIKYNQAVKKFSETFVMDPEYKISRPVLTPGYIGKHCLMPNTVMLSEIYDSVFLKEIINSNKKRAEELGIKDEIKNTSCNSR